MAKWEWKSILYLDIPFYFFYKEEAKMINTMVCDDCTYILSNFKKVCGKCKFAEFVVFIFFRDRGVACEPCIARRILAEGLVVISR